MHPESSRRREISAGGNKHTDLRLDQLLVKRGLSDSREKAKAMIMAGLVEVNGAKAIKAGHRVPVSASVQLKESSPPYVSRGGQKLEAALRHFAVDVKGKFLLDVGASTGGFTDCLLKHGARKITAIDVGYGQLDWKLRQDPRVHVLEKTNIRHLKPHELGGVAQGAVVDVSFISLRQVIPPLSELLKNEAFIIALIKPQFEVGREQVGKGGVVRDPSLHTEVVEQLASYFRQCGWMVLGHTPSPLLGPKGNREFFIHLARNPDDRNHAT